MLSLRLIPLGAMVATIALAAPPEVVTQEATGEAAIVKGDVAKAEREARERALRSAVEQVAGVYISSDTLTQNSQLVSDRIFSNSAGYVRKFEVLSKKNEKGVVSVTVRAQVGAAQIDKDLEAVKALINRLGNRKLVVLLQEQAIDSKGVSTSSGVMSTVLTEAFKKDGWTMIDPNFAAGKLKLSSGVSLGSAEAKEIGDLTRSEYILYGQVNFRYQPPSGYGDVNRQTGQPLIYYVTGEYELAVFATDSGDQLAKISGKFNTRDVGNGNFAVSYERTAHDIAKNHGAKVLGEVRGAVLEHLRASEQNGGRVVMHVQGLRDYAAVQAFKKAVGAITNVREVKPGTFSAGKAQFDVTFLGTTDDLAGAISESTFKKKKLSVTGVTANTVEVVVER